MPEKLDREAAAAMARLTELWLSQGAKLEISGMLLFALALAIMLLNETSLPVMTGLACAFTFGIAGQYFAMRVAFDRRLFLHWAERWERNTSADPDEDMARLDDALSSAGLRKSSQGSLRDLQSRQQGAFRLFRNQAIVFLLQCITLIVSAATVHWVL